MRYLSVFQKVHGVSLIDLVFFAHNKYNSFFYVADFALTLTSFVFKFR